MGGSQEEEDVETHKAKCTLRLIKVLAEVMPNNFSASEVCERLVVLLRQDDCSIGKEREGVVESRFNYYVYVDSEDSPSDSDTSWGVYQQGSVWVSCGSW